MSVIGFAAEEIKAIETAAHVWVIVEENIFAALYVGNAHAFAATYGGDLVPALVLIAEYEQAKPLPTIYDGAELLAALHSLTYNICDNDGRSWLTPEGEAARRRLVQSVALELLTPGCPWVKVAETGSIRRVSFDLYEIGTLNPSEGSRARPYLMDGQPHQHEGFVTDRPWEAFKALWEMNDECHAHWLQRYEHDLRADAKRLGIV